jgi:preprotein translocase subunit SecD
MAATELDALNERDMPALTNALDSLRLRPRNRGFSEGSLVRLAGSETMVGKAVTGRMVARDPGEDGIPVGPTATADQALASLPAGVSRPQTKMFVVRQGTVVLEAVPVNFAHPSSLSDPNARFYVLRDHVALFGNDITNPRQSTDQAGAPDVRFGFSSKGQTEFQNMTAQIARRGDLVSRLGQTLNQHFAVALDTQLITVPSIDFKSYPAGIQGGSGGDITAGFTTSSAHDLATELRLGALPIDLKLIAS